MPFFIFHDPADRHTRYLAKASRNYYDISPQLSNPANYPANEPLKKLATGLAAGWKAFGDEQAVVLFVVQDGERNVFDQTWLEFELLETYVFCIFFFIH